MNKDRLANYVEVADRIVEFIEKYPEGSLQPIEWDIREVGEQTFIVYTAAAYRDQKDRKPGIGTAWEPYPGKTSFTKDSELMNAETSSFGRALAAIGFVGKKGKAKVATKEEVQARQPDPTSKVASDGEPAANGKPRVNAGTAAILLERAEAAGVDHNRLSTFLTSKGVKHDPFENKGRVTRGLMLLDVEQGAELDGWLEKAAAKKAKAAA